jgi:hypothetical protein
MRRLSIVAFVVLILSAQTALAWGEEGHRIVCRIAYDFFTPQEQARLDALARGYVHPPGISPINKFTDGCVFADDARRKAKNASANSPWRRFKRFDQVHFLNLPRDVGTVANCPSRCVLAGIAEHAKLLRDGADDQQRAEGLLFLSHWIGDAHQPLHVSFADDAGGNGVRPVGNFYVTANGGVIGDLHAVWDTGILVQAMGADGWKIYADRLQARITAAQRSQWAATPRLQWAQESYDITRLPDVEYCVMENGECVDDDHVRDLGADYQSEFQDDVELRLQQAGVRLAALIRQNLF